MIIVSLFISAQQVGAAAAFTDTKTHWAKSQINAAVTAGWINGYNSTSFKPNVSMTRAEFLKSLVVAKGYKLENIDTPFKDDKGWYRAYIAVGLKNSIIKIGEYKNSQFIPNQKITREEIAKMSIRALDKEKEGSSTGYMSLAKKLTIMSGYPDGSLGDNKQATRAEAVVIISRVLVNQKGPSLVTYNSASQLNTMVKGLTSFKGTTTISAGLLLINVKGTDAAADNTISILYNKELKTTIINVYASGAAEKAIIKEMLKVYYPKSYQTVYDHYVQAAGQLKISIDGRSFQIKSTSQAIQINIGD